MHSGIPNAYILDITMYNYDNASQIHKFNFFYVPVKILEPKYFRCIIKTYDTCNYTQLCQECKHLGFQHAF